MVAQAILLVIQSGTNFIPELMAESPEEVLRAWQALASAGSIESARLAVRQLSVETRQVVIPLLMSVIDAFGRGERVSFMNVTLRVPDWLVELSQAP